MRPILSAMDWMTRTTPTHAPAPRRRRTTLGVWLLATQSLVGCAANDDFFTVDALWDINSTPSSRANCREQGIEEVRLRVEREDGSGEVVAERFPCEAGHAVMDVPTKGGGLGLVTENALFTFTFDALDRQGRVLQGTEGEFETLGESLVELPIVDIFQPSGDAAGLTAEWEFDGGGSCADHGVAHVALDIAAASDGDFLDPIELVYVPCEQKVIADDDRLLLATGEYWVRYVSLDANDTVVEVGEALEVSVPRPGPDIDLPTWTFQ